MADASAIIAAVGAGCFMLGWFAGFAIGRAGLRGGIVPRGARPAGPPPVGGGTGGAPNIAKRPAGRY